MIEDPIHLPEQPLDERPARDDTPAPAAEGSGILPHDTMAEAGRKTLGYQFVRMLAHEEGTRRGDDPGELHDMRVAIRRLRSGFRVFDGYLDDKKARVLRRELRRSGRVLGSVRDADVFLARAVAFRSRLPEPQRADMNELIAEIDRARAEARTELLEYIDGKRYRRLVSGFGAFLDKPQAPVRYPRSGQPRPHRVRHVVPVLVTTRVAEVRAHEEWINGHDDPLERLHRLRISLKRLRYTLEFFREILSPVTGELIEELKNEQDHLGALHDAHVAAGLIQRYLATGAVSDIEGSPGPLISSTITEFLGSTHRDGHHYLEHFPDLWERLRSSEFRRAMLGATEDLM